MKRLFVLVFLLSLVGCTGDKDRFTEFETEYAPTMQDLTALVKATDRNVKDYEAISLVEKCKSVSEKTCKSALVLQEKANALKDEEARKVATTIANDINDAGKFSEELGAMYSYRSRPANEAVLPGHSRYEHIYDDILKAGALRDLVDKIETEHATLKGVMFRK